MRTYSIGLISYIETALWSTNDESDESGGEPLDKNYSIQDLSPEALETMRRDWEAFAAAHPLECYAYGDARIAHDFWLTRNGHGAGFWDGDYPEPQGQKLTEASKAYPEQSLYVGDDGKIYIG